MKLIWPYNPNLYFCLIIALSLMVHLELYAQEGTKKFEAGAWYGLVFSNGDTDHGLRRTELKYQPNSRNLLFAFYDNALILENKFLASMESTAPIVGVGIKHDWNEKWFSKIDLGYRFLSLEDDQQLYSLENVYFISDKSLVKLITQFDVRQNDDLLTLGLFFEQLILRNTRLEIGFFHSENLTLPDTYNERIMLSGKVLLSKSELLLGTYYDILNTQSVSISQYGGAYGIFVFPISDNLKGKLFANYNQGFFVDEVMIFSLGADLKF